MSDKQNPSTSKTYRPYQPTRFRSASHHNAHAEEMVDHGPRPTHPLICNDPPLLITTQEQLTELLLHLRTEGRFAYDSEFIGELTYVPKLCLIQVATTKRVDLIDPLAEIDLKPFWELLCDNSVEKVVHAGQQDIEPVFRNAGCAATNVFDTQICAGFIGLAYPVSLSKLIQELLGVRLGKGLTFTHWDQRPLSVMQLRYAADDVRFLLAARDEIGKRLDALDHNKWAREECDALCEPTQYHFDPKNYFRRVRGSGTLSARNQAVLRELTVWRDACARDHNVPARSFLKDEILLDLAKQPIKSIEKLERVRGLPRPVEQAHGAQILSATAKGLAVPSESLPETKDFEPTPQQRFRADALFATMQCLAAGKSIDPALVTSRQEIGEFYRCIIAELPCDKVPVLQGWRNEAVGKDLMDIIASKSQVQLTWKDWLTTRVDRTKY